MERVVLGAAILLVLATCGCAAINGNLPTESITQAGEVSGQEPPPAADKALENSESLFRNLEANLAQFEEYADKLDQDIPYEEKSEICGSDAFYKVLNRLDYNYEKLREEIEKSETAKAQFGEVEQLDTNSYRDYCKTLQRCYSFDQNHLNIELMIIELANGERSKEGLPPFKQNDRLSEIARNYSKQMFVSGFHHTDEEGRDAADRLDENGFYYLVAGENLYSFPCEIQETEVASMVVDGWMRSPSHRDLLLDRDEVYSDVGVGIYCQELECKVAMVFAGCEEHETIEELHPNYSVFFGLFSKNHPFQGKIDAEVKISASGKIDVYLVEGRGIWTGRFLKGLGFERLRKFEGVKEIDEKFTNIEKGWGLIIANDWFGQIDVNVFARYGS